MKVSTVDSSSEPWGCLIQADLLQQQPWLTAQLAWRLESCFCIHQPVGLHRCVSLVGEVSAP